MLFLNCEGNDLQMAQASVVIIFLDEERFLEEAIASVFAQSYCDWELLLVDDGSSDRSSHIATELVARTPGRVRYLQHGGHANRGMSASRNLGLREASSPYIAFLDGDDVWLPDKLERQLALLAKHPDVAMTYGATLYWHTWDASTATTEPDYVIWPGVEGPTLFEPPELLTRFLEREINMPCMGSMLMRRAAALAFGGWEDEFRGLFEDQVFFAKLCATNRVLATNDCLDKYRQHHDSTCAVGLRTGQLAHARKDFHEWLGRFLKSQGLEGSPTWNAFTHEVTRSSVTVA
jgi:glycosyltransferase involved in cell wall biosynthesis